MITVCNFTPSRIGIITSRRTYSKPSLVGLNSCGVSAGRGCPLVHRESGTLIVAVIMKHAAVCIKVFIINSTFCGTDLGPLGAGMFIYYGGVEWKLSQKR